MNKLSFITCLSFLLLSCTSSNKISKDKSSYSIKIGKTQELKFDSNITTGFSWHCTNVENEYVKLVEKKYIHPDTDLMGAPGHEIWKFEGIKEGEITLSFEYKRSFGKKKAIKNKEFTFKIK